MKKNLLARSLTALAMTLSIGLFAQSVTLPPSGGNQRSIVTQYIGSLVSVTIEYNSPDVHAPNGDDRTGQIWGQLVPYGLTDLGFGLRNPSPWRAGANQNTTITFSHDVTVQGKAVQAGTYGLHMIVNETDPWVLILSKNASAWGSYFYEEKDDALRVDITPKENPSTEWLTYNFVDRQPTATTAQLEWEKIAVPFTIEVPNMNELYVDNFRKELQGSTGFNYQSWNQAANFCLNNDLNLEEALTWAETAISGPFIGVENFNTLSTRANIEAKLGKQAESDATMKTAMNHPSTTALQVHGYGRQLIAQGQKEKALEVFKQNQKKFKGAWPTNYGLARGYSAMGDYKSALKYLKLAQKNIPEGDTVNPPVVEANIKKLESGQDIN